MYNNNNGFSQKFQGNWKCGSCGAAITELPFNPDPSRLEQLKCGDCHKKMLAERGPRRNFGRNN